MPAGVYPRTRVPVVDRVLARVTVHPLGCWEYTGTLNPGGYGQITPSSAGSSYLTHRIVYEDWFGKIPDGLVLDHLCANRRCCNPAHLEPVTQTENVRRSYRDGRHSGCARRDQTHCKHGHEFSPENTYTYGGKRKCRTCHRALQQRRRMKRQQQTNLEISR